MQADGSLSVRQRCTLAPWRIRPPQTWSKVTSTTSSGRSAIQARSRPLAPAARLARAALAGLVRRQPGGQLALLLGGEAGGVPDLAQVAVLVVEAEDEGADGARLLARAPAAHDGVDRAHALDLDHALALVGAVGAVALLGDDALGAVQPRLGLRGVGHARGQVHGGLVGEVLGDEALQPGAALVLGQRQQDLVVEAEQVEGDEAARASARRASRRGWRPDGCAGRAGRTPGRRAR